MRIIAALNHYDVTTLLLTVGVLLTTARVFGEIVRRLNQPAILGELLAGVFLGPTVLGRLAPGATAYLFPAAGSVPDALTGLTTLSIVLFMLVAGMEVNLSTVMRQGRVAVAVSVMGILAPFTIGFAAGRALPNVFEATPGIDPTIFALFLATALSISALPVIARILMDLDLYRSDLGMLVIAAAVFNDIVGWIIFAVLLGLAGGGNAVFPPWQTALLVLAFAALMLTVGRRLVHRLLPWVLAHTAQPGGVLALSVAMALFAAALTESFGVHAIFGAFLFGVALGQSHHLREHTRTHVGHLVTAVFAPLFFATIGLHVDFIVDFDLRLTAAVLVIACAGKILGCAAGAWWCGMPRREAWSAGLAMNARGAMEIILGVLALAEGLIVKRMFVALVVMALITSAMSGPIIQRVLRLRKPRRLARHVPPRGFVGWLTGSQSREVIEELCRALCSGTNLDAHAVAQAAWRREESMSTGLGNGLAVPHARLATLKEPLVAVGLSGTGIDFDAPDGEPAHLIFLILTPQDDDGAQVELLADIARTFRDAPARQAALQLNSHTELLSLLNAGNA